VEIALPSVERLAWICMAHFTVPPSTLDVSNLAAHPPGHLVDPGRAVAEYTMRFRSGREAPHIVRRRFEINDVVVAWGQLAFAARPHREPRALSGRGPYADSRWGIAQRGSELPAYTAFPDSLLHPIPVGNYWIAAFENPNEVDPVVAWRLRSLSDEPVAIGGITVYHGRGHPLRRLPPAALRVTTPDGSTPALSLDLGCITRQYPALRTDEKAWRNAPGAGLGSSPGEAVAETGWICEGSASDAATLRLDDIELGFARLLRKGRIDGSDTRTRVEALPRESCQVTVRIRDSRTGLPTPSRVHFRAVDGRYLPPDGHRHEVNDR
jgi:hypothetical protein